MEIQPQSLNTIKPFYIDRKYRPPIPKHAKITSLPISPLKKYSQVQKLEEIERFSRQKKLLIAEEVRNSLNLIKTMNQTSRSQRLSDQRLNNSHVYKITKEKIKSAIKKILKKNHQIYLKFKHICEKKQAHYQINFIPSQEQKDAQQQYIDELTAQIQGFLERKKFISIKDENQQCEEKIASTNNFKKIASIQRENHKNNTQFTMLSQRSSKICSQKNKLFPQNQIKNSQVRFQSSYQEQNLEKEIEKNLQIILKKSQARKGKLIGISELNFFPITKGSQKKIRKNQREERCSQQLEFKWKKQKQKNPRMSENRPKQSPKKEGLQTLKFIKYKKKARLKKQLSINQLRQSKLLKKRQKNQKHQNSIRKQTTLKDIQEDDEDFHENMLSKYEQQKLMFNLIKQLKQIKKARLNPSEYNERQPIRPREKKRTFTNKKMQKLKLQKQQQKILQQLQNIQNDFDEDKEESIEPQKTINSLWDELIPELMKKKTSCGLFKLKRTIQEELRKYKSGKFKKMHDFNVFLNITLRSKLERVSQSWLGSYNNASELDQIDSLMEKIDFENAFQGPLLSDRSHQNEIIHYSTDRLGRYRVGEPQEEKIKPIENLLQKSLDNCDQL